MLLLLLLLSREINNALWYCFLLFGSILSNLHKRIKFEKRVIGEYEEDKISIGKKRGTNKIKSNSPHRAKITVNSDAAGNRTETLNSSICNRSTENENNKNKLNLK